MEDVEMRVVLQAAGVAADAILAVEHKAQGSRPISTPCAGTLESSLKLERFEAASSHGPGPFIFWQNH